MKTSKTQQMVLIKLVVSKQLSVSFSSRGLRSRLSFFFPSFPSFDGFHRQYSF